MKLIASSELVEAYKKSIDSLFKFEQKLKRFFTSTSLRFLPPLILAIRAAISAAWAADNPCIDPLLLVLVLVLVLVCLEELLLPVSQMLQVKRISIIPRIID